MSGKGMLIERRNALKALGSSVLTATTYGGTVTAREKPSYVGYTYKPNEGDVLGTVTATFDRSPEKISGTLSFEDRETVEKLGITQNAVKFTDVERFSKEQPERGPSSKPISKFRTNLEEVAPVPEMKISSVDGGGYTGYIRTSNDEKVAYSLVQKSKYGVDELLKLINGL